MSGLAIETEGLTRRFGDLTAVDGVDLRVRQGTVFGFLGPNGAGKTTTLHLLLGILPPTSGTAHVAGLDVANRAGEVRRRCGALLEHNGLFERLSALENLEFHARMHRMAPLDREERCREALERLGWWDRRQELPGTWSRGMKQQLAIARATLHRPQVLFLDEPTAGFDPAAAAALRPQIRALARNGTTVFLTTHNLREAEQVCDEVAVLRQGKLLAVGAPDGLRDASPRIDVACGRLSAKALASLRALPGVAAARPTPEGAAIEMVPGAPAAPIVAGLVRLGVAVEEVRRRKASLEEDFLALVADGGST